MSPVATTVLCSVAFIVALGWIYSRLAFARAADPVSEQWWDEFSPERYAPMARLLTREDFEFVRRLPGYRRGMERRLRSRRIAIFSSFLNEMRRDFDRLQSVGHALLISGNCTPGFQDQLFRQRTQFLRCWWLVRTELMLYRLGVDVVDPSSLVTAFRGTARMFVPEPEALPALG